MSVACWLILFAAGVASVSIESFGTLGDGNGPGLGVAHHRFLLIRCIHHAMNLYRLVDQLQTVEQREGGA